MFRMLLQRLWIAVFGRRWAASAAGWPVAMLILQALGATPAASATQEASAIKTFVLKPDATWLLELPSGRQFDASALLFRPDGALWTVNDRESNPYVIRLGTGTASMTPLPEVFSAAQLQTFVASKNGRYDSEGLAQDEQGRVYLCEEGDRWILRWDPRANSVERLAIDWSPAAKYFSKIDRNASFEGIAVGGGRIYVANERSRGRIVVVDLETLRVIGDFGPHPAALNPAEVTYSDLSWHGGKLYALLREFRCVIEIEPETRLVTGEFDVRGLENDPEFRYRSLLPVGNLEGLAVDANYIWLVTDNNGQGRVRYPEDKRPMLFRCRRPGRSSP